MPHIAPARRWITLALVALAACNDSTGPGGGPSLQFTRGASVTDTVGAILPTALVVEVHDSSGAPAPLGTVVRFERVSPTAESPALVSIQANGGVFSDVVTAITDGNGQTSVIVALGARTGVAHIAVTVPSLSLLEYATYTVTPGNAARTVMSPVDTALYVGNSLTLHASVVDRFGNPRSDAVTFTGPTSGLTVSSSGVVTASTFGRYYVKGTGAGAADSSAVTVLPKGKLAAVFGKSGLNTIYLLDADGSNYSAPVTASGAGHPAWLPGTASLVYDQSDGTRQALYILGADGVAKPFLSGVPATMTRQSEPAPSMDGKWVYFTATDSRCAATDCIARLASDGSGVELIVTAPSRDPSPSPDGSKVAYSNQAGSAISVFDAAAQTASAWSVAGSSPAWSPDGSQIAYVTGGHTISFIAPDGTATRSLPSSVFAEVIHGWSPDGKWLIVQNAGSSMLVDATSGATLLLQYSKQMIVTSMK